MTTVAEAAFQDRVWRPRLEPLRGLATLRLVHCTVDADVAVKRIVQRRQQDPQRLAHADPGPRDAAAYVQRHRVFDRVSVDAPWLEVDTTDGCRPGLGQIVAFINAREPGSA